MNFPCLYFYQIQLDKHYSSSCGLHKIEDFPIILSVCHICSLNLVSLFNSYKYTESILRPFGFVCISYWAVNTTMKLPFSLGTTSRTYIQGALCNNCKLFMYLAITAYHTCTNLYFKMFTPCLWVLFPWLCEQIFCEGKIPFHRLLSCLILRMHMLFCHKVVIIQFLIFWTPR